MSCPTQNRPRIAFYAPMKAPDHPVPSGDREIARLTVAALKLAGFEVEIVSELRTWDGAGDGRAQDALIAKAGAEAARLIGVHSDAPPDLWFTYHSYYKAPDLLGPQIAAAFSIPYVISEPSISPKRRQGPWSQFAAASEAAIAAADHLFWTTARDRPALEDAGFSDKMVHLPPFLPIGGEAARPRPASRPVRLLTVAMMRPGDKVESYRRIALTLEALTAQARPVGDDWVRTSVGDAPGPASEIIEWRLDIHGGGPAQGEVMALFARWPDQVTFHGVSEGDALKAAYRDADVLLWPGVGEGVGMVYLEAQAAGVPVVAEDHSAQRDVVAAPLYRPGDPAALAEGVRSTVANREVMGTMARMQVVSRHSVDAAAQILRETLWGLVR